MTGTVVKMRDGLRAGPLMLLDFLEDIICVKARLRDGALAHRTPLPVRAELDVPPRDEASAVRRLQSSRSSGAAMA